MKEPENITEHFHCPVCMSVLESYNEVPGFGIKSGVCFLCRLFVVVHPEGIKLVDIISAAKIPK